jgi:two-component system LytT family response regulator
VIRALIVDDEAPARRKLRGMLERAAGFAVVGEAEDGDQAVERIGRGPTWSFSTCRCRSATVSASSPRSRRRPCRWWSSSPPTTSTRLAAFEVEALDYLLKPFAPPRLERVLERVRARLAEGAGMARQLERLPGRRRRAALGESLLVERSPGAETLLPVEAIDLVRAERNALRIFAGAAEYVRQPAVALASAWIRRSSCASTARKSCAWRRSGSSAVVSRRLPVLPGTAGALLEPALPCQGQGPLLRPPASG